MQKDDLTYEIRGAIYDVYKALGPGLLESVYEEALCFELSSRGLSVERQKPVPVVYKDKVLKTDLRLDIIVEDQVIIELKSVEEMKKVFSKQLLTYLRLTGKKIGLLVNFNTDNILTSIIRIVN
ncbi:MAG: GxxExxY protein [Bacteroidaceae bacterium]|nr:GxxExxY protein [Bacteroidaceae bacterium]